MFSAQQMSKAGLLVGLPFLLLSGILLLPDVDLTAQETAVLTFLEFESSCIDLGHYDAKGKKLTDFLRWALNDGQAMESALDYAPLPESMRMALLTRVDSIK